MLLKKWIIDVVLASLLCAGSYNSDLLEYGMAAAQGQFRILIKAKAIEKFLTDSTVSDEWKKNILLIQDIKQFTVDSLGFTPTENYTKVYNQQGKPLLWVVTGCEKYQLKPKYWWFPIVGRVSYKGFFKHDDAEKEAILLEERGYETRIRDVNAWSTLGWFKDPIMSSMLDDAPGDLANLIIHELSHKTIYIKNNAEYSENLASFIGDKGARLFLRQKYGKDSKELSSYETSSHDEALFSTYLIHGAARLDSLYKSESFINDNLSLKEEKKQALITDIVKKIEQIPLLEPLPYKTFLTKHRPNNALFIIFMQYHNQREEFEKEFQERADGNLKHYIDFLTKKHP